MKRILKKIVPEALFKHYKFRTLYTAFYYDAVKYLRHSNTYLKNDTKEKLRADIIMRYHAVEKGLTMPERRFNFGRPLIEFLISECQEYALKYGTLDLQVRQAVMILVEYLKVHEENDVVLDDELGSSIMRLSKTFQVDTCTRQIKTDSNQFFAGRDANLM